MIEKLRWNDVTKEMPEDESVVLLWVRFPRPFANPFWTLGYVRDGIWYEHCTEIKMTANVMYWAEPKGPTEMDTETETFIAVLHERMEKMSAQARIELLLAIAGDYCTKCGYDKGGRYCNCDNDD